MYTVRAQQQVSVRASCAQVFAVLTDYEHYGDIFPQVREVEVHSRDEGVCRVTLTMDLVVHLHFTLRLVEDSPVSLRWTLADANLVQQMNGSWKLTSDDDDRTCTAAYTLEVKLAGQIPRAVEQRLVTQALPEMLERLRRFVEARHSHDAARPGPMSGQTA